MVVDSECLSTCLCEEWLFFDMCNWGQFLFLCLWLWPKICWFKCLRNGARSQRLCITSHTVTGLYSDIWWNLSPKLPLFWVTHNLDWHHKNCNRQPWNVWIKSCTAWYHANNPQQWAAGLLPNRVKASLFLCLLQTYGDQSDSEKITLTHSFSLHKHI